jgi:molecular chaperone DnaK (HSP70)
MDVPDTAPSDVIVGIDLGTTFSLVAYVDAAGPHVIRDASGDGRVPSVIGIAPVADGPARVTIGWEARNHALENPRATVYSIKRLIGKGLKDVERELPYLAYAVTRGPRETVRIEINGRPYSPEELSSVILRELKLRAEQHLHRPVERAVITVPAYFDDAQRQATRDAGRAAGLDVVRIINEPTAAALAYGIGLRNAESRTPSPDESSAEGSVQNAESARRGAVALPQPHCREAASVTPARLDKIQNAETVAVYDLGGGTFDISVLRIEDGVFQVLATCGDTHLGGDDFDRTIIELVTRETQAQFGVSIDSPTTRQALRGLAEAAKVRLSEHSQAALELDLGAGRLYRRVITRAELHELVGPLVDRTIDLCRQALRDAGLALKDLNEIILVGGSTRMPLVRQRVAEFFGRPPYTALNPDEVVALGAAMQASVLGGQDLGLLLLDVTPLSLGIETLGGAMGKLILRNATIPCRATEMFTTFVDGQTAIKLNVLQGERELAADCRSLGEFELRGIPPMPAGIPKVEVEFLLDANGILNVAARELRSGVAAAIQVLPSHGLTRDEVDRITRESVTHARADLDAHRRIDLLNQVEFDIQKTEQVLARVGAQLNAGERERIGRDIHSLRALARGTADLDALHRALDDFGRSTLRLAEIGITEALKT